MIFSVLMFVIVVGVNCDSKTDNKIKGEIFIVDNVSKARAMFPDSKFSPLNRIASDKSGTTKGSIVYTLGERVNGDKIQATDSDSGEFATAKDIELLIQYPESGRCGAVISYVIVLVDQSSNVGEGYVVSGGIGQCQIGFVIVAKSSTYFRYDAFIYGRY